MDHPNFTAEENDKLKLAQLGMQIDAETTGSVTIRLLLSELDKDADQALQEFIALDELDEKVVRAIHLRCWRAAMFKNLILDAIAKGQQAERDLQDAEHDDREAEQQD